MKSPAGRNVFREFLRTEYSEENMLFWLACEELKNECNKHTIDEKARMIYEDYISILSPKEVRGRAPPAALGGWLGLKWGSGGGCFLGKGALSRLPLRQFGDGVGLGLAGEGVWLCVAVGRASPAPPEPPGRSGPGAGLCCGAETSRGHQRAEEMPQLPASPKWGHPGAGGSTLTPLPVPSKGTRGRPGDLPAPPCSPLQNTLAPGQSTPGAPHVWPPAVPIIEP